MALKLTTPPADAITTGRRGVGRFPDEAAELIELAADGDTRSAELELRQTGDAEVDLRTVTNFVRNVNAGTRKSDFYGAGAWEASYDKNTLKVWVRCIDADAALDAGEARQNERDARGNGAEVDEIADESELVNA